MISAPSHTIPIDPPGNAVWIGDSPGRLSALHRPLVTSPRPQAGFPSPAADYVEESLDLNEHMVRNPPATFYVRVRGHSMVDAKIHDGDTLVVDRSVDPRPGMIVVASYNDDLYVKRYTKLPNGRFALTAENFERREEYPLLYIDKAEECIVWGVVTGSIRRF